MVGVLSKVYCRLDTDQLHSSGRDQMMVTNCLGERRNEPHLLGTLACVHVHVLTLVSSPVFHAACLAACPMLGVLPPEGQGPAGRQRRRGAVTNGCLISRVSNDEVAIIVSLAAFLLPHRPSTGICSEPFQSWIQSHNKLASHAYLFIVDLINKVVDTSEPFHG